MSTERVCIELTEEQREELKGILWTHYHEDLYVLVATAPTVTLPDESEDKE